MDLSAKATETIVDIDDDDHLLSIRLRITQVKGPYSSIEVLRGLRQYVTASDITGIAPLRASNCWCVTVSTEAALKKLADQGHFMTDGLSGIMAPFGSAEIRGRLLWLPLQTSQRKIHDFLSQYGTIVDLWREKYAEGERKGLWNGTRSFRLIPNADVSMDTMPHLCEVDQHQSVLTILGRKPRCFRCNSAAHVSRTCDKKKKMTEQKQAISGPSPVPPPPAKTSTPLPAPVSRTTEQPTAKTTTAPVKPSPTKPKPRSQTPPAKPASRRESSSSDSEDDELAVRCGILADRALDLAPKQHLTWTENFLTVFTDQSRAKLSRMRNKLGPETVSALIHWCEHQEARLHDGPRAVRG